MKQGSSGLTIRERQTTYKPAFELNPKKVSQWISELPIANLGESSKSVYRLLVDVNQTVIDSDKRFAIISIIEPVVKELSTALEKQFIKNHITLSDKQKKIAALLQAIQTELTLSYHTLIDSILMDGVKRSQVKFLAITLNMAMKYHGFIILRCFQLYTSIPSRVWREIYCIYQIALNNKVETQSGPSSPNELSINTHFLFIRILLLSIANPYQLRQQDIQMLWDILPELSEHATLMSHAYNKQHFIIALDSGLPPIHKSLYESNTNNNLKLTASSAIEHLKLMLASVSDSGQQNLRKSMLLRHLVQCWSHGTHRSFARTPCNVTLDISIGLGATHYLLTESAATKNIDSNAEDESLNVPKSILDDATLEVISEKTLNVNEYNKNYLSSSEPDDDAWAKLYRPNQIMKAKNNESEAKNRSREAIVQESYRLEQVALLNMSPGGYCIQIQAENLPKHAQTGEVIGFLEYDNKSREHWSVAVVRWVRRQTKDNAVQMGVQLLAPGAVPINIQLRNNKLDNNEFQRALILPALSGVGQPATLLTNPLSFSVNNKVRILDHGLEYDARLVKEFASSTNFKQFQYEKIDDDKGGQIKKPPVVDSSFNNIELDEIWDLI